MQNRTWSNARRRLWSGILAVGVILAVAKPANADAYSTYLVDLWADKLNTFFGAYTPDSEKEHIANDYEKYTSEQASISIPFIGQPAIYAVAGTPQSPQFPAVFALQGQLLSVDFGFIDPATGLATTGPLVASVEYEVNVDPLSPTDYVPIGTSFDAASDFSISYLFSTDFEPTIQAIPFDASGNPIIMPGVDGENVARGVVTAVVTPEPSAVWLLAVVIAITLPKARSRKAR